jgi:hypothetical protein
MMVLGLGTKIKCFEIEVRVAAVQRPLHRRRSQPWLERQQRRGE